MEEKDVVANELYLGEMTLRFGIICVDGEEDEFIKTMNVLENRVHLLVTELQQKSGDNKRRMRCLTNVTVAQSDNIPLGKAKKITWKFPPKAKK